MGVEGAGEENVEKLGEEVALAHDRIRAVFFASNLF